MSVIQNNGVSGRDGNFIHHRVHNDAVAPTPAQCDLRRVHGEQHAAAAAMCGPRPFRAGTAALPAAGAAITEIGPSGLIGAEQRGPADDSLPTPASCRVFVAADDDRQEIVIRVVGAGGCVHTRRDRSWASVRRRKAEHRRHQHCARAAHHCRRREACGARTAMTAKSEGSGVDARFRPRHGQPESSPLPDPVPAVRERSAWLLRHPSNKSIGQR